MSDKKRPYLPKDGSETPYTILIPLKNFKFCHHTYDEDYPKEESIRSFVGREKLIKQLKAVLESPKKQGSYLVAGYRGAGKTSLINRVIGKYKNENKNVIPVRINLGHDAVLDTRNVLFNIITAMKHAFHKEYKINFALNCIFKLLIIIWITSIIQIYFKEFQIDYSILSDNIDNIISNNTIWPKSVFCIISIILIMSYRARYLFFSQFKPNTPTTIGKEFNIIHKLDNLYNRVAYSEEKNFEVGKSIFGLKSKTVMPSMMEPQIELELLNILEESKKAEIDIIFIFDELDKISLSVTEPNSSASNKAAIDNLENETVDGYVIRRKKRVDSLLGSLKTLITTGKARFFFIAGRDILDSYQAEKGSTSSLYESLFNQVFEVPSFLTDNSDQDKSRLHSMIEYYVCSRLMDEENAERL